MPTPFVTRTVRVNIPGGGYDVIIGQGVLAQLSTHLGPAGHRAFIVADDAPDLISSAPIVAALAALKSAGRSPTVHRVHADEPRKSLATLGEILNAMTLAKLERGEHLIALGGGIVGDVAGFAAASYRRGIPFIQCPTTLLAMVDASVGGKTGVNLDLGPAGLKKNMAGAFHQPAVVLADLATLATLPDREYRCGLAECVKHALLAADFADPALLEWIEERAPQILAKDPATLAELVARNVAIKAAIVAADVREEAPDDRPGRALLNLGHTFAHALESLPDLQLDPGGPRERIRHGEAVALGLVAASITSARTGLCTQPHAQRIAALVRSFGLPTSAAHISPGEDLVARMRDDKKVLAGRLRLVLLSDDRRARIVADPPAAAVLAGLDAIRRG